MWSERVREEWSDRDREEWLAEIEATMKNQTTAVTNDKRVTGGWIKDNEQRMMKDWGQEETKTKESRGQEMHPAQKRLFVLLYQKHCCSC